MLLLCVNGQMLLFGKALRALVTLMLLDIFVNQLMANETRSQRQGLVANFANIKTILLFLMHTILGVGTILLFLICSLFCQIFFVNLFKVQFQQNHLLWLFIIVVNFYFRSFLSPPPEMSLDVFIYICHPIANLGTDVTNNWNTLVNTEIHLKK